MNSISAIVNRYAFDFVSYEDARGRITRLDLTIDERRVALALLDEARRENEDRRARQGLL